MSVAAVVGGLAAWGSAGGGAGGSAAAAHRDAQPERIMSGREVFDFKSLGEMVATAPVIVKAEVVSVQPGRSIGSAEDGGIDQARDVTLSVTTSYKKYPAIPLTIVMEEWGWDGDGNGYQVENLTWSQVGDKGFYFLERSDGADRWQLVNTQGRALDKGGWLELSADPKSAFATSFWWDTLDLEIELRRLTDTKNPPADLPQPQTEPEVVTGDAANSPAPEDGAEDPIPSDSTADGSEPTPYPSPS
ncbi:hypothetical protein OG357_25950 [Streptomyces sp. NBC_01255]|uniref:hypothetical protein n=1 Tax=Streptomyces sp. NBC_01255 TaxID=2903798 RepID=UPI002E3075A7|nr:hypothetical protein [Streptomyces sp. NBC_01255]